MYFKRQLLALALKVKSLALALALNVKSLALALQVKSSYVHPATGSSSAIDLSICSLDIFLDMQWKTLDDLCGSDHYPISIS